jgi:hypothetical protein
MREFSAAAFLRLVNSLAKLEEVSAKWEVLAKAELPEDAVETYHAGRKNTVSILGQVLDTVQLYSDELKLPYISPQVERVRRLIANENPDFQEVACSIKSLRERVEDETNSCFLLSMPNDRVDFYKGSHPFGDRVAAKIPGLSDDIEEAAKCLALDRHTAAVFHTMRVMERGVRLLAKRLSAAVDTDRAWGDVLADIRTEVNKIPHDHGASAKDKERHAKFSEAEMYLRNVKDAIRNKVAHPKQTYSEEQARRRFDNAKLFIRLLVNLR